MSVRRFSTSGILGYSSKTSSSISLITQDSQWNVLTATAGATSVDLSWPTAAGSPISYEVSIGSTIINVGNVTSYTVTNLIAQQTNTFKVRPVYSNGSKGSWSYFKNSAALGFNSATGGNSTTDVSNYNGTGQTWRIHTFTSSSTFTVTNSALPFSYLVVAGGGGAGGGGGNNAQGFTAGGGGSGGVLSNTNLTMTNIAYTITVGAGGSGGGQNPSGGSPNGANGGNSSIGALITASGGGSGGQNGASGGSGGGGGWANGTGGGGSGTLGQGTNGNSGGGQSGGGGAGGGAGDGSSVTATGSGRFSTITGSNVEYSARYAAIGGGGGNGTAWNSNGASGNAGRVIIAYRIA